MYIILITDYTAVVSKGDISMRVCETSYNKLKLGRWASQLIQGKAGLKTRVVAVYVPILVSQHGHKKVACQQWRVLLKMGIKDNVIEKYWSDFWLQVDKWIEAGEQLIIGGDWNRKVVNPKFLAEFKKRNLIPATFTHHGSNLPATHNNGSFAIDEIFLSSSIHLQSSGYLEHGANLSDHRPLWIDVSRDSILGLKPTKSPRYAARRLKTNDPRVVKKYVKVLREELALANFDYRSQQLLLHTTSSLTEQQKQEYETLDKIRENAAMKAEAECRKLKMGNVHWSPELQRARDRITYFNLSRRKFRGRKVSTYILYRLAKKTGCNAIGRDEKDLTEQLDKAFTFYKTLKKQSYKLREDYLDGLALALEKKRKGKKSKNS